MAPPVEKSAAAAITSSRAAAGPGPCRFSAGPA
jgi:hypothetical protein